MTDGGPPTDAPQRVSNVRSHHVRYGLKPRDVDVSGVSCAPVKLTALGQGGG